MGRDKRRMEKDNIEGMEISMCRDRELQGNFKQDSLTHAVDLGGGSRIYGVAKPATVH